MKNLKRPQKSKDDDIYFDDCPVCQAIKQGKNSLEELKEAFQKAKDQGAIVGGKWFEKKD